MLSTYVDLKLEKLEKERWCVRNEIKEWLVSGENLPREEEPF